MMIWSEAFLENQTTQCLYRLQLTYSEFGHSHINNNYLINNRNIENTTHKSLPSSKLSILLCNSVKNQDFLSKKSLQYIKKNAVHSKC